MQMNGSRKTILNKVTPPPNKKKTSIICDSVLCGCWVLNFEYVCFSLDNYRGKQLLRDQRGGRAILREGKQNMMLKGNEGETRIEESISEGYGGERQRRKIVRDN